MTSPPVACPCLKLNQPATSALGLACCVFLSVLIPPLKDVVRECCSGDFLRLDSGRSKPRLRLLSTTSRPADWAFEKMPGKRGQPDRNGHAYKGKFEHR